ncbi:MAG TPA: RNA polymerase sigma factor [Planctomycetota bacterium]
MQAPQPYAGDLRLRDALVRGEREAAEGFFRRHLGALYEFVHYRVGGNRALAEDLVQDTFLTAIERLAAFDGRSSLHTWLCGIARNKIRAHRRRLKPALIEDVLAEADPEIEAILMAIDREPLPEAALEREETRELVGATLSSLPPDYRDALVQKYVEELSTAEIAARAGKNEKAAESTLTRARAAFGRVFTLLARKRGGYA